MDCLKLPGLVDTDDAFARDVPFMAKTHAPYAPEFRRQMVELVRAGRDPADLAREFEPSAQAIRNWVAQADRPEGAREQSLWSRLARQA